VAREGFFGRRAGGKALFTTPLICRMTAWTSSMSSAWERDVDQG
jgi:hypothetical protein